MGRPSALTSLARMLAIVPWVADRDGPRIDEVCERFGITRRQLLADLEVLPFVGLYPYTPDQLVDVVVDDDRVWIDYADMFRRPFRLTPDQALALVAAGSGLLAVPGADADGPLARGLAKLAGALGVEGEALDVELGSASAEVLAALQRAVESGTPVRIDYYAFNRDEETVRDVEPWRVFADQGHWYVHGWCRRADGERLFRVDRIRAIDVLPGSFEHPVGPAELGVFSPTDADPRVTLRVPAHQRWVVEQYPVDTWRELEDGRVEVVLVVSAAPWLDRVLLSLGGDVEVVDDPEVAARRARTAARVLARYR